jgi:hypothetical protein
MEEGKMKAKLVKIGEKYAVRRWDWVLGYVFLYQNKPEENYWWPRDLFRGALEGYELADSIGEAVKAYFKSKPKKLDNGSIVKGWTL